MKTPSLEEIRSEQERIESLKQTLARTRGQIDQILEEIWDDSEPTADNIRAKLRLLKAEHDVLINRISQLWAKFTELHGDRLDQKKA